MSATSTLPSAVTLDDTLRKAHESLAAGKIEAALRTFDDALRLKPSYAPTWSAKAEAHRKAGNLDDAVACYAEALRRDPDDEPSWFGLALALHALGRREEEVEAYDEVLRRDPRHVPSWMNRGTTLHELEEFEEALRCHDRVLAMRPEIAAAWNNRGAALLRLGYIEESLDAFDEALSLDPAFEDARANQAFVVELLGRTLLPPNPFVIPPPVSLRPDLATRVLANLGLPAVDAWRRARSEGPEDFVTLGAALLDDGEPGAAVAAFARAEKLGAGPVAAVGKLLALQASGAPSIVDEAARILAAYPQQPRVAMAVACIREAQGDLDGAAEALASLLDNLADLSWAWNWKGILHLRCGRTSDARDAFGMALTWDPMDPEAWANLAVVLRLEHCMSEALEACERALEINHECASAWNTRAVIYATQGRVEDAYDAFRRAARGGEAAIVLKSAAQFAASQTHFRQALRWYDAVLGLVPDDREAAAGRRRMLGHVGNIERLARARLRERLVKIPGIKTATANRILRKGFDSAAKLRKAGEASLRKAAGLTGAQARAVRRAFRNPREA